VLGFAERADEQEQLLARLLGQFAELGCGDQEAEGRLA